MGVYLMGFPSPRHQFNQGFTLVELLIGGVVSAVVLGAIAALAVHQIRIADTVYASATIDRQFKRLSDLLKIEVGEACILRGGADPRTAATPPDSPCKPLATSNCTGADTADLRLLIPIQGAGNTISYNIVRYYVDGTELRREGPQIGANGLLIPITLATPAVIQRVLTNVSAFTPRVSADCTWVRLRAMALTVPRTTTVVNRPNPSLQALPAPGELTFYSGASQGIN
jgi:hypothetical protein